MAATALEIVSLERIKREFRLPVNHASDDDLLEDIITGAVNHVSKETGLPLVDYNRHVFAEIPRDHTDLININQSFIRSINQIEYWSPDVRFNKLPDQTFEDFGRSEIFEDRAILYPADRWPVAAEGSKFKVDCLIGVDAPDALKDCVVLWARFLYKGDVEMKSKLAYDRAVQPFIRKCPSYS